MGNQKKKNYIFLQQYLPQIQETSSLIICRFVAPPITDRNEINFVLIRGIHVQIDSSEDADYVGCVTDRLPTGREITIPVYANYCSAHCYEKEESALARYVH